MLTEQRDEDVFVTREEAARLARCCVRLIDQARFAGTLRSCKPFKRRVLLERDEVLRWVRDGGAER